jgi:hypothetical protein
MSLSILYCNKCDTILAAAPGLDLTVECVSHTTEGVLHRGGVALRLPDVDLAGAPDLTKLAAQYPKSAYASSLVAVGNCT